MKEKRWDLTRAQIVWLQQIKNQNWMDEINSEMIGSILYRTDYNEDQKLKLNALRETYISALHKEEQRISMSGSL